MIYVSVKELIAESQLNTNKNLMTIIFIIGFTIMMFLDILLS